VAAYEAESPRSPEPQGGVQVIARVGQVLRALDGENQGLSLAQLADRIGLPRSTVHRIVTALAAEGLVATASPAGRVRIGPEFARLASSSQADLWTAVEPFMRRIFDEIGETVDCSVVDGANVRVIHGIPARHHLRVAADVGTTFPLHCSAKGRAILAAYPAEVAARMLPDVLERFTDKTVTDRGEILQMLETVRKTGVAYNREEATRGICAAAIALRAPSGALLTISVPVPTQRYADLEDKLTRVLLEIREEALAVLGPLDGRP
jgi:DNA-binding IclR family transcriptional regulator